MVKIAMIHVVAAFIVLFSVRANASFEYDVDMPNSGDPKMQMIRINVNGCDSKFLIEKDKFEEFSKDKQKLQQLVKRAIEQSTNGCPKP